MEEPREIFAILKEYADVFSKDDSDLGCTHLTEHVIDTGDALPVKYPPRRMPLALADAEVKETQDLKERNTIQESNSPWTSIVITVKKSVKLRVCCDYRAINKLTRKDAYPYPGHKTVWTP